MAPIKIEIAICTWNRSRLLRQTLAALEQLAKPNNVCLQLIVVDNNSSDNTVAVVKDFQSRLKINFLQEAKQGHCHARNRAIEAASAEFLIWIDDDVVVEDHWLNAYVDAFANDRESSFWGGPILPEFDHLYPKWIDENWEKLKGCYAFRDLGQSPLKFSMDALPYGANFAIRSKTQERYAFATDLGRTASEITGDDELDMFRRILSDGNSGAWMPGAKVRHIIDSSRSTTRYVARYFEGQGRAMVAQDTGWSNDPVALKKESKHELFWFRVKRYFTPSDVWVSHLIRGSLARGQWQAIVAKDS